ncbi:MAG TPA: hypothetical protein VMA72_18650 [Streptosporangiaceae bacterium]|nr:hypothetical protein [Streptosporangiaceae bacterium]
MDRLLQVVRAAHLLCLDASNPEWDNARGYLFDTGTGELYFPVSARYLHDRKLDHYEVLIWSHPRLLVAGRLSSATSDLDVQLQAELASARGLAPDKIDVMLFDQRNHKPRKNRYKLALESVRELAP